MSSSPWLALVAARRIKRGKGERPKRRTNSKKRPSPSRPVHLRMTGAIVHRGTGASSENAVLSSFGFKTQCHSKAPTLKEQKKQIRLDYHNSR